MMSCIDAANVKNSANPSSSPVQSKSNTAEYFSSGRSHWKLRTILILISVMRSATKAAARAATKIEDGPS